MKSRYTVYLWHDNGQKAYDAYFVDGKQHGVSTWWYDNGQKHHEKHYVNGKQHGKYTRWVKDGTVDEVVWYYMNIVTTEAKYKSVYDSTIETHKEKNVKDYDSAAAFVIAIGLTIAITFIVCFLAYIGGENSVQQEAVDQGHAVWQTDTDENRSFKWKGDTE